MASLKVTNYSNPYANLPDIKFAGTVFDKKEQAESEQEFNVAKAKAEYDSALELMLDERNYNSPDEQVKRLRQAGINPDLQNINAEDSSTLPAVTSPVAAQYDASTKTNALLSMSQLFMQAIPQAVSIVQGCRAASQQLQMNELEILGKADKLAQTEIARQFSLDDLKDKTSYPQAYLGHYSKRTQRHIQNAIDMYVSDPNNREYAKGLVYDNKSKGQSFRKGYLDIISNAGFSLDDETFVGVLKEYNDIVRKSLLSKSKYDASYYGNLDGSQQAQSENARNIKQGLEAENTALSKLMARANELLDSDSSGDKVKGFLLYTITSLIGGDLGHIKLNVNSTKNVANPKK